MIEYKPLEHTSLDRLHRTFVEAFSDYQVEIDLPIEKFEGMLRRRGYNPELSIGAFDGDTLTGFVLNGLRSWGGKPTLYDCGTGVMPEYRKRGITKNAFNEVVTLIQANQIDQYLLEVIQSNHPAVELYRKQGFYTTRTLACYQIDTSKLTADPPPELIFETRPVKDLDWTLLKSFWDFEPSWQNSIESVTAAQETMLAVVARAEGTASGTTLGYGIIETSSGDIPHFAVRKEHRRRGIGTGLLSSLVQHTQSEQAVLLNVDAAYTEMQAFLLNLGFEHFIDQYEMLLDGAFGAGTES